MDSISVALVATVCVVFALLAVRHYFRSSTRLDPANKSNSDFQPRQSNPAVGANSAFRDANELPSFSVSEVAKHCSKSDVWIIVRGNVYDVTPYVELHPGGDDILRHAGGDATVGFEGPQHPSHVMTTASDLASQNAAFA